MFHWWLVGNVHKHLVMNEKVVSVLALEQAFA